MNSLLKLKERTWKNIYDKGDDSNVSDFDNHDIDSSENELNSIEDFERAEDEEAKRKSNESLNSLNTHQQPLKTFIDKGYSIYKIDKENLIDSISKSTLYYQKINTVKAFVVTPLCLNPLMKWAKFWSLMFLRWFLFPNS